MKWRDIAESGNHVSENAYCAAPEKNKKAAA